MAANQGQRTALAVATAMLFALVVLICSTQIETSTLLTLSRSSEAHLIKFHGLEVDTTEQTGLSKTKASNSVFSSLRRQLVPDVQHIPYQGNSSWLLKVSTTFTALDLAVVEGLLGLKLTKFIPPSTFVITAPTVLAHQLADLKAIEWMGVYPPEAKLSQRIVISQSNAKGFEASAAAMTHPLVIVELSPAEWTEAEKKACVEQWKHDLKTADEEVLPFDTHELTHMWVELMFKQDTIPVDSLMTLVTWLSKRSEVYAIDLAIMVEMKNYFAQGLIQSFARNDPAAKGARPIWARGLKGEGITTQIVDTGLDYGHCYFYDEVNTTIGPSNRKVVFYEHVGGAAKRGDVEGHGTHVAASLAGGGTGASYTSDLTLMEQYVGMAPEAKIAFWGRYQGSGLSMPTTVGSTIFKPAYDMGIRISSNSWGCKNNKGQTCNVYDATAKEIDDFIYNNKDMLVLFAAGNDGLMATDGSVDTPATAKNVISVGAGMSSIQALENSLSYVDWTAREQEIRTSKGKDKAWTCCDVTELMWSSYCCKKSSEWRNKLASTAGQYGPDSIAEFTARGPTFDNRFKPQLIAPGQPIISAKSSLNGSRTCGPSALRSDQGTSMATPIAAGGAVMLRQYLTEGWFPSGTKNESDKIKNPSAALMIALLTAGAQQMQGYIDPHHQGAATVQLDRIPSIYQGYGRVDLEETMMFDDSAFNLFINERTVRQIGNPGAKTYCVVPQKSNSTGSSTIIGDIVPDEDAWVAKDDFIKVTLAWLDPAAEINAQTTLVNDLDILIGTTPDNVIPGNFPEIKKQDGTLLREAQRDPFNNVEIATWPLSQSVGMNVYVVVRAARLRPGMHQNFSVVIKGNFNEVRLSSCEGVKINFPMDLFKEATRDAVMQEVPEKQNIWLIAGLVIGLSFLCILCIVIGMCCCCEQLLCTNKFCCCCCHEQIKAKRAKAVAKRSDKDMEKKVKKASQNGQVTETTGLTDAKM